MIPALQYNPNLLDYLTSHDVPGFYSSDQFDFLKVIEDNFFIIKQEYNSIKLNHSLYQTWPQEWLVNVQHGWEVVYIKKHQANTHKNTESLVFHNSLMPATLKLLNQFLGDRLTDVALSKVAPGAKILPHRGRFTNTLRCHLGLQIPNGDCKIKVGNESTSWVEGKILVIDDRLMHEVWNNTDQERIVLIFDFIPDSIPGFPM